MENRGKRRLWIVVALCGLAAIVLVAVLAGIALNKKPPTSGKPPPPPLPPLSQLPAGRGLDWSAAGLGDGAQPLPSAPAKFNVRDFGAKGDNATDDTQALQAAVAAANSDPEGGVVLLPAGAYVLRQPLPAITRSNVVLRGEGEGATSIYIPLSLADVYPNTWGTDASGKVWTQWSFGGAFISLSGGKLRSSNGSTRLASISGEVEQGATVLPVDKPRKFHLGQWVRIYINDASTDGSAADSGADEGGVSLQAAGGSQPQGSIAAWVYGDGLADSGSGSVLHTDEISFTAKVASIGDDWVALDRGLPFPVRNGWRGEAHAWEPTLQGAGLEHLTIQFAHALAGVHLGERGYNALELGWGSGLFLRNLTILNADNGIKLTRVDRSTLANITVDVTAPRWAPDDTDQLNGHHAISLTEGHANLVTRFQVAAPFHHDVSLSGGAMLNVISDGRGADLNIDLHRAGAFGNLFSRLDMGAGGRPFKSGGRDDRGAHSGRQNTFWNLGSTERPPRTTDPLPRPPPPPPQRPPPPPSRPASKQPAASSNRRLLQEDGSAPTLKLPPCSFGPLLNFVGPFSGATCGNSSQWLVQGLGADAPSDLFSGQRAERNATSAAASSN